MHIFVENDALNHERKMYRELPTQSYLNLMH
jgi:hypothetical protein